MSAKNLKSHLLDPVPLVMVSEDDSLLLATISLLEKSFSVQVAGIGKEFFDIPSLIEKYGAKVVLLDITLLGDDIHQLEILTRSHLTRIILVAENNPAGLQTCFEGMRYGGVDYVLKSDLLDGKNNENLKKELTNKIIGASKLDTSVLAPSDTENNSPQQQKQSLPVQDDIIFCEDCGARNIFPPHQSNQTTVRYCTRCGDLLETHLINRYKRTNYVTVIGAGPGSYRNLINIIPNVSNTLSGAIIIVAAGPIGHVDSLARYLDALSSVNVLRITTGSQVEGGNCYVAASDENFFMKPYSTSNKMERAKPTPPNGPLDIMIQSVSESFKHNSAGLFLSGLNGEGENGLHFLKKNGGISAILSPPNCIHKQLGEHILRKCSVDKIVGENDATQFITELHSEGSNSPATA